MHGVQENSADYAISEKLREQIRSLFQDDQNVQNGSSMVKTAERGIDQIVDNLRTMKELAIDAANDSNTDEDRHTIQKEIDQRREVINDIALGTKYNGKILLDGRYSRGGLQPVKQGSGGENTNVTNLISAFRAGTNATSSDKNISYSKLVNGTYVPKDEKWSFEVGNQSYRGTSSYRDFGAVVDFSAMQTNGAYPDALHGQGFTILCGTCEQYINVLFDSKLSASESSYNSNSNEDNVLAREFIIGVKDVTNSDDLAEALLTGFYAVSDKISSSSTPNNVYIDNAHSLRIVRDNSGQIQIMKYKYKADNELQFREGTIPNPKKDTIPPAEVEIKKDNPLWVQHGTQSGQRMHIYINDMRSKALGIDKAEVTTREKANSAISIINNAIETALDEATTMGAYLQRLETSFDNVVTMRENTQGSESTIRDADMAKEITEYTKYNILSQSSQAMLANANQNSSFILGMLQ